MSTRREFFQSARKLMQSGDDFILLTVLSTSGSVPGKSGFSMLVTEDGNTYGTIGGGALEYEAVKEALSFFDTKASAVKSYSLSNDKAGGLGMVCGGSLEVSFRYISHDDCGFLKKCEQEAEASSDTVYIFGGGHVAKALVPLLARLDFDCIVFDDRKEFANAEHFPAAQKCIAGDFSRLADYVRITSSDYVCIMTRGHEYDYIVQKQVLRTPAYYIGVMGSKKKTLTLREKLLADGFSKSDIERCRSPIGLDIKARTPEEIAVSIAGELILMRAQKNAESH